MVMNDALTGSSCGNECFSARGKSGGPGFGTVTTGHNIADIYMNMHVTF